MSGLIRIGFTGTRNGMSLEQKHNVRVLMLTILHDYGSAERQAHHGDCVGADAEFHEIAESLGFFTVGHPPSNPSLRAFCKVNYAHPPLPYTELERDTDWRADVFRKAENRIESLQRLLTEHGYRAAAVDAARKERT